MRAAIAISLLLAASAGRAQTPPASRVETIERERDAKAETLSPETLPKMEAWARKLQDQRVFERILTGYKGWRPVAGGLATGSGFALGPEYNTADLAGGYLELRASAQLSTRLWQKYGADLVLPRSFGQRLNSVLNFTHRNYNSLDYYGPGPHSTRSGRTNYRLEDTLVQGITILRPEKKLKAGFAAGYLWTNVGPGRRHEVASTDKVYSESQAPGIQNQSDFLRYGALLQFDNRDNPLGPKTGGNYVVQWVNYHDQSRSLYDFRRLDVDFQQYFGFFNNLRRIALRAHGTFTETAAPGRVIPFYLRPTVGGADDLRGYRSYRFNDANALVLNSEYRWEIFSGMDGALFFDAGKVMPSPGHLALGQMKGSAGFGLRANVRNQTFLRFDVGFSREGFMIWFKFNDAFNSQRFGTGAFQPLY